MGRFFQRLSLIMDNPDAPKPCRLSQGTVLDIGKTADDQNFSIFGLQAKTNKVWLRAFLLVLVAVRYCLHYFSILFLIPCLPAESISVLHNFHLIFSMNHLHSLHRFIILTMNHKAPWVWWASANYELSRKENWSWVSSKSLRMYPRWFAEIRTTKSKKAKKIVFSCWLSWKSQVECTTGLASWCFWCKDIQGNKLCDYCWIP